MAAPGAQPMKRCPTCGAVNAIAAQVCSACGHAFSTPMATPAPSPLNQTQLIPAVNGVVRDFEYWMKIVWAMLIFVVGFASTFYWLRITVAVMGGGEPRDNLRLLTFVPPALVALPIGLSLAMVSWSLVWIYRTNGRSFAGMRGSMSGLLAASALLCIFQIVGWSTESSSEVKARELTEAAERQKARRTVRVDPRLEGLQPGVWSNELTKRIGAPDRTLMSDGFPSGLQYGSSVVWLTPDGRVIEAKAYLPDEVPSRRPDPEDELDEP